MEGSLCGGDRTTGRWLSRGLHSAFGLALLFVLAVASAKGETVDGTLTINGLTRNYSIYLPTNYGTGESHPLMLALHPFNTLRWDAKVWRDTLIAFAEANGLILICPDGGPDGNVISEEIDTLLATALLDSAESWYSVDTRREYVMGFSVGGRATYLYSLANSGRFGGYIPIGAAINGRADIQAVMGNARNEAFYVIHGTEDSRQTRFHPALELLEENQVVLFALPLSGVGHTIDFPDRNAILSRAYRWIDSVNTFAVSSVGADRKNRTSLPLQFFPNPLGSDKPATLSWQGDDPVVSIRIADLLGRVVAEVDPGNGEETSVPIPPIKLAAGLYLLEVKGERSRRVLQFQIQ